MRTDLYVPRWEGMGMGDRPIIFTQFNPIILCFSTLYYIPTREIIRMNRNSCARKTRVPEFGSLPIRYFTFRNNTRKITTKRIIFFLYFTITFTIRFVKDV